MASSFLLGVSSILDVLLLFLNYCSGTASAQTTHKMDTCIFCICECGIHTITHKRANCTTQLHDTKTAMWQTMLTQLHMSYS